MKEGDFLLYAGEVNTLDHLLLVTNKGNMIYRPSVAEFTLERKPEHISQTILNLAIDESIVLYHL